MWTRIFSNFSMIGFLVLTLLCFYDTAALKFKPFNKFGRCDYIKSPIAGGSRTIITYLSDASKRVELKESQLWKLSINLEREGCKSSTALCNIRFVEDRNYEPPQGRVFIEDDFNGFIKVDNSGFGGGWTLSEDKNDRKDGLWIWGLFEEPKYPFLYFSLAVFNSTILPSGEEEPIFNGMGIPNDRLNFRFAHTRDPNLGSVISNGELTYQLTELVKADPFGIGGTVNVGDSIRAGTVTLTPVRTIT